MYAGLLQEGLILLLRGLMMPDIPDQLRDPDFRFIKLKPNSKEPFGINWKEKTLTLDQINGHDGNIGIVCGYGKLVIVDVDKPELCSFMGYLPATFVVKTGRGFQYYFYADNNGTKAYYVLKDDAEKYGELRIQNCYCVTVGSTHPNGKVYDVFENNPIATTTMEEIKKVLSKYIKEDSEKKEDVVASIDESKYIKDFHELLKKDLKLKDLFDGNWNNYSSRSEAEVALLCKLIYYKFSKEVIWNIMNMCSIGKWQQSPEAYRETTYKSALKFVEGKTKELKDLANLDKFDQKMMDELEKYNNSNSKSLEFRLFEKIPKPEPPEWLIVNLVPSKGLTILAGSAGCGKSLFTQSLIQSICNDAEHLLGKFIINSKGKPVIVIDQENDFSTIYERLTNLGGVKEERLFYCLKDFDLKNETNQQQLKEFVERLKPCLIVLDTFRRSHNENENDSRAMNEIYNTALKPLEESAAIILIHHKNKSQNGNSSGSEIDGLRGSTDIVGCATSVFSMTKRKSGDIEFKCLKMRPAKEPETFFIKIRYEDSRLSLLYHEADLELITARDDCVKDLNSWLITRPITEMIKTSFIQEAMQDKNHKKRTITEGIAYNVENGILVKQRQGYYKHTLTKELRNLL